MSIVSSTFELDGPVQLLGRQYVRESHTDNVGLAHLLEYLAEAGADYLAIMNARVPVIAEQIAQDEFVSAVSVDARPTLRYNSVAQFVARFRAAYLGSSQQIACALAWWLIQRINAGDVTDAQVQNAFNLTAPQYATLKANFLIPQHDHWAAVLTAQGQ